MLEKELSYSHHPVMLTEVVEGLNIRPDGIYCDATFGRGGHSKAILDKLNDQGRLIALDRDEEAQHLGSGWEAKDPRFSFIKQPFSKIAESLTARGVAGKVNGLLIDLGVSSPQLDDPSRGFSFLQSGPLDMRMDKTQTLTAKKWVMETNLTELSRVLKEYGDERYYQKIAEAIIAARSRKTIDTTQALANIIETANPKREHSRHPATRSFQAIRIAVNNELEELSQCLMQGFKLLAPQGRLCVLTYHSLEDKIVKQFIQEKSKKDPPELRVISKLKPSREEILVNRRARSALLRISEKIGGVSC